MYPDVSEVSENTPGGLKECLVLDCDPMLLRGSMDHGVRLAQVLARQPGEDVVSRVELEAPWNQSIHLGQSTSRTAVACLLIQDPDTFDSSFSIQGLV